MADGSLVENECPSTASKLSAAVNDQVNGEQSSPPAMPDMFVAERTRLFAAMAESTVAKQASILVLYNGGVFHQLFILD